MGIGRRVVRLLGILTLALFVALTLGGAAQAVDGDNNAGGQSAAHSAKPSSPPGQSDQDLTKPQPPSNADFSGNGANTHGPYDSTRDGSASQNGNGDGKAVGKPCAGCVGKADNKNPKGQLPGGSDPNAGYECDRNSGIGKTNPAHTGCKETPPSTTPPPTTGPPPTPPSDNPPDKPGGGPSASSEALPVTGVAALPLLAMALGLLFAGGLLSVAARRRRS